MEDWEKSEMEMESGGSFSRCFQVQSGREASGVIEELLSGMVKE